MSGFVQLIPDSNVIDLVDIAVLLNYERTTTEPRFRHAKLREVAYPGEPLESSSETHSRAGQTALRYVFDTQPNATEVPDLPSNLLPLVGHPMTDKVRALSPKQLETIFHQARESDGSYTAVTLLQHFFDLYPPQTEIRCRHVASWNGTTQGIAYTTTIDHRVVTEMKIRGLKTATMSNVMPSGDKYESSSTMDHAFLSFLAPEETMPQTILDLSSMQFGDAGRGPGSEGQSLFVLETFAEYATRIEKVSAGLDRSTIKTSYRVGPHGREGWDEWLKQVAQRAKNRWEKRNTERWCSHCGKPVPSASCCDGCHAAWFCSKAHRALAWPFHKGYCKRG
ncbi:hypothetical protein N0V90_008833 [Kalmusia sp. IMI 367209]|nr:hypothetical protein N0V90_008833 [Kalmusia sp. IMI 367209]